MTNKIINLIAQLFLLNIIYVSSIIFSLGILFGPATSALFNVSKSIVDGQGDIYGMCRKYIYLIKYKFKYSFFYSVIFLVILFIILTNLENINYMVINFPILIVIQYYILFELLLMSLTLFYLNGNYHFNSFKGLYQMALYLSNRHISVSIFMIISVILFSYIVINFINMSLIMICFSLFSVWISLLWKPIVKKYQILNVEGVVGVEGKN